MMHRLVMSRRWHRYWSSSSRQSRDEPRRRPLGVASGRGQRRAASNGRRLVRSRSAQARPSLDRPARADLLPGRSDDVDDVGEVLAERTDAVAHPGGDCRRCACRRDGDAQVARSQDRWQERTCRPPGCRRRSRVSKLSAQAAKDRPPRALGRQSRRPRDGSRRMSPSWKAAPMRSVTGSAAICVEHLRCDHRDERRRRRGAR